MNLADRLMANTHTKSIQKPNRARLVTKQENGDLRVVLNSGKVFDVGNDDELFQAFVVYSILAEL